MRSLLLHPINHIALKLRQFEHIIDFLSPLHRMSGFNGNFNTRLALLLLQLAIGEEHLVGNAIPSGIFRFVDMIFSIQNILENIRHHRLVTGKWALVLQIQIRTQKCWTAAKCCSWSEVRLKCVKFTLVLRNSSRYLSDICVQYSCNDWLCACAACWIFVPCSSVPVLKRYLLCRSRNFSYRTMQSLITAEYRWPMCGAGSKRKELFITYSFANSNRCAFY